MAMINNFLGSILFWAAWIVIPLVMEIIPSVGSILILIKKKLYSKQYPDPLLWPEITLIIPVYNSEQSLGDCIRSINDSDYPNSKMRIFRAFLITRQLWATTKFLFLHTYLNFDVHILIF